MIPDRVRAVLDRRRSNAAGPHKTVRPHDADWLAEWESERDSLEVGELYGRD